MKRTLSKLLNFLNGRLLTVLCLSLGPLSAHENTPVTHQFEPVISQLDSRLALSIVDGQTGRYIPARFSLMVDGRDFVPEWVDDNGIAFTSIHESKNQRFTALFSKGTGEVLMGLPLGAGNVSVTVAKGFEYRTAESTFLIEKGETRVTIEMNRWVDLQQDGWIAVDEHLHYDRLDPGDDELWFSMLEADGLAAGHFMVLKGGMVPGIWSRQFAYGPDGQGTNGKQLLVPGQEYRDSKQGHINLLGINEVILPYSTGGTGTPPVLENFPPLFEVLNEARSRDAFVGVAHGGTLGREATSMADAVLGAVDFWEISNGFIYNTENWYRLMNCGYFLPAVAGTDLPNWPFRDSWQPMFGSIRTYVNTGGLLSFNAFREALKNGRSFISGGPLIDLRANGKGMGDTIRLPEGGGVVSVKAALHSPLLLRELHVVADGKNIEAEVGRRKVDGINHWSIDTEVEVTESGWIAAWGKGIEIDSQKIDAMAHTGVVKVIVGNQPVRSKEDALYFVDQFQSRREFYRENGVYESDSDRAYALSLFDRAISELKKQTTD